MPTMRNRKREANKYKETSQVWRQIPIIPAIRDSGGKFKDHKFKNMLGYIIQCQKTPKQMGTGWRFSSVTKPNL